MDVRATKEAMSRAKLYATRGQFVESLKYVLKVLVAISRNPTVSGSDIRSQIRETLQIFLKDPNLGPTFAPAKKIVANYNSGQEKVLYNILKQIYDTITSNTPKEKYEVALARKLNLDKYLIRGTRYLAEGNFEKALLSFNEAINYYKDEKGFFLRVARLFKDAGSMPNAALFLKKELEANPDNEAAKELLSEFTNKA